jgi:hypothetical protein
VFALDLRRDAAQVIERHGQKDQRIDIRLSPEQAIEMSAPDWRDEGVGDAPHRFVRQAFRNDLKILL